MRSLYSCSVADLNDFKRRKLMTGQFGQKSKCNIYARVQKKEKRKKELNTH